MTLMRRTLQQNITDLQCFHLIQSHIRVGPQDHGILIVPRFWRCREFQLDLREKDRNSDSAQNDSIVRSRNRMKWTDFSIQIVFVCELCRADLSAWWLSLQTCRHCSMDVAWQQAAVEKMRLSVSPSLSLCVCACVRLIRTHSRSSPFLQHATAAFILTIYNVIEQTDHELPFGWTWVTFAKDKKARRRSSSFRVDFKINK